jgi:hypothetical protein
MLTHNHCRQQQLLTAIRIINRVLDWGHATSDGDSFREPLGNEPQKSTQSCNLLEMNNHSAFEAGLA